jgi:hypothetical protein
MFDVGFRMFSITSWVGGDPLSPVTLQDFGCLKGGVFCGVFDGHGPHGHTVAQLVRDFLPQKLASNLKSLKTSVHEKIFLPMWKELFLKSFMMMDQELQQKPNIDCFCSGTTAVTLVREVYRCGLNVFILFGLERPLRMSFQWIRTRSIYLWVYMVSFMSTGK